MEILNNRNLEYRDLRLNDTSSIHTALLKWHAKKYISDMNVSRTIKNTAVRYYNRLSFEYDTCIRTFKSI